MEQATSFSASLLQSVGGDTAKAAEYANTAIQDMSDNANKMGTDIGRIQDAYQGFAKQNYTMLDNLKLGYGGTKTEMERLLKDAEKLSGQKYDISNLNDVFQAIHVIQQELDITGTTAKEADKTISGSFNSMKAAWQNLLTGMAGGGNVSFDQLINNMVDSVATFGKNIIPVFTQALQGISRLIGELGPVIAQALPGLVKDVLPPLLQAVTDIVIALAQALPEILTSVVDAIITAIPMIIDALTQALPEILNALTEMVIQIALALTNPDNLNAILTAAIQLFMALVEAIPQILTALIGALPQIIDNLVAILTNPEMIMKLIAAGVQLFIALVTGLFQVAGTLIGKVGELLGNVIGKVGEFVGNMASKAIEAGKGFFSGIVDNIKNLPSNIGKTISNVVQKVGNFASNVINKAKEIGSGFINNIMNFFKDLPGNIWNTLLSVITNVGNFAIDMANKAKEAGQDVFNAIVDKIGEIPGKMLELGKNIVEGLWNGISDMVSWIGEKIKGFGEGILNGLKDFFGIHSPSKVMADVVGSNLAKGVIEGVNKEKGNAKKSATELAKVYVSAAKSKVTELRQANKISEAQEIDYWQQIVKTVKKGTSAYKTAVNKLTQAKNTLRSDVAKLTSTYASDVAKVQSKLADDIAAVNAQLEKDIQSLRDQYTSAVASRASSIMGQVGLFSAVSLSKGVDSSKLIENLQGQVEAYREWDETLNVLRRRVGSGALLEELENQGVSSLNTLNAIKDMSDEELQTYIDLYNQKAIIAKNRATVENQELLATVNAQISALRTQATQQIEELKTAANQEIKELTAQYKTDLKALGVTTRKQSKQVGTQIANGIKDGLDEQMPKIQAELQKQVAAMVNSVKKQLKIKSPSRVFAEIGSYMAQGLGVGWQDEFKAVSSDITDTLPSANGWSGSLTAMFEDAPAPSGGGGVTVENQVFNIASGFDYRDVERQVMEGLRRAA